MMYLLVWALHWAHHNVQIDWVCEGNSYMALDPNFRPWLQDGCTSHFSLKE